MSTPPLLEVTGLAATFAGEPNGPRAVDGVSFTLGEGEALGLVGESGCGKTVTALCLLGLLPRGGRTLEGSSVRYRGEELVGALPRRLREVRGRSVAMVFQEPRTALNPVLPVGEQVGEGLRHHLGMDRRAAAERAAVLLAEVGIPDPTARARAYPHELSGGMRQRVAIAMALACEPELLVADEPTTALDATIRAQILDLLVRLREERRLTLLLITHDLASVAEVCERVAVMRAGRLVETGATRTVFGAPGHDYTRDLLDALPSRHGRGGDAPEGDGPDIGGAKNGGEDGGARAGDGRGHDGEDGRHRAADVVLSVRDLGKRYRGPRGGVRARRGPDIRAVEAVSFEVRRGETLGIVGESGSGKSTLARALLRLIEPDGGTIRFEGRDVGAMDRRSLRAFRRRAQIVFQDPWNSLNPRLRVGDALDEVLRVHGLAGDAAGRRGRVRDLLERVGLRASHASVLPHQLSGGERQRVAMARALAVEPELLILDEPVSALDVPVRAQVVSLLSELQAALGLTYLFIAHDLALVEHVSDRVAVVYLGRIVEIAGARELFHEPRHPYTRALLAAAAADPRLEAAPRAARVGGEPPDPRSPPPGCPFHPRCTHPEKDEGCAAAVPPLEVKAPGHRAACIKEPAGTRSPAGP